MFDLKDGISNNMASAVPLRFVTKMEIQYGVRLSVMFYHKDGNSIWRPSVRYVLSQRWKFKQYGIRR
jgi:hypothetical protein